MAAIPIARYPNGRIVMNTRRTILSVLTRVNTGLTNHDKHIVQKWLQKPVQDVIPTSGPLNVALAKIHSVALLY